MSEHKSIWYLSQIPSEVCDLAVAEYAHIPARDASMGEKGENYSHINRNTTVRFSEHNHWFGNLLYGHAHKANKDCGWGYDINDSEPVQFAHYGVEQHYDWHVDNFPLGSGETDRKVSVVCLMNDPSEFEGGEFQVRLYQDYTAQLGKGSIIAFPSILYHRVTPVLSGFRMSATIWTHGPRFR